MKPVEFDYERPATLDEALVLLAQPNARVLAGGQSIGPMLNLRLVQPTLLVDITAIEALRETSSEDGTLRLGACVTHTAIEDGNLRDVTNKAMASVARNIAYRAVRNRGTIGGSLVHADPAADWLTCLSTLGADVIATGAAGQRRIPVASFVKGAFETDLQQGEILRAVSVPVLSESAKWGFYKFCRKEGDFAEAIGAVLQDGDTTRTVLGATNGPPLVIDGPYSDEAVRVAIDAQPDMDAYDQQVHFVAGKRAAMIAGVRMA